MDLGLISVRYARALLKASNMDNLSEQVYSDMLTLSNTFCKVKELAISLANPMLTKSQKESLLQTAAGDSVCDLTSNFFRLVLKEGRESIMQFIANSYISLYRKQNNLIRAKLSTTTKLSQDSEDKMRKLVERMTNGNVEFTTEIDSDLIGGFVLEYDTYRLDASVKRQLKSVLSKLK